MKKRIIPYVPPEERSQLSEGVNVKIIQKPKEIPAIEIKTNTKFFKRLWYFISNPFNYLLMEN